MTVVNTNDLSSVLNANNPVIITQLPQSHFHALGGEDGATLVALNLADLQVIEFYFFTITF